MKFVKGNKEILYPINLLFNSNFSNNRGLFNTLADITTGTYFATNWFVTAADITSLKCQVGDNALRFTGTAGASATLKIDNDRTPDLLAKGTHTLSARIAAAGSIAVGSVISVSGANTENYKKAGSSVVGSSDTALSILTDARGNIQLVFTLGTGAFDFTVSNVCVFQGALLNPNDSIKSIDCYELNRTTKELVLRLDYGETEGVNKFTFDGSEQKEVNISIPVTEKVWGYKIAKANSDSAAAVTYTDDAVGMTPAAMSYDGVTGEGTFSYGSWKSFVDAYFRPVMLKYDGTVDYELNHADQTKKLDGTTSDVANLAYEGNAMVEVKKIWTKITEDDDYIYVQFSNIQADSGYKATAYTDANGNIRDAFYYSMFEGANRDGKFRSISGIQPSAWATYDNGRPLAGANGSGWDIPSYSQYNLLALILTMIAKDRNSQLAFGNGASNGTRQPGGNFVSSGAFAGTNTWASVKALYIENLWANYKSFCNGLLYKHETGGTANLYFRGTPPYNATADGYTLIGTAANSTPINSMYVNADGVVIPKGGGSSTLSQDYCDAMLLTKPTNEGDIHILNVGGEFNLSQVGIFMTELSHLPSFSGNMTNIRLSYLQAN